MEPTESPDGPVFPPEVVYRIAELLPHRVRLEVALASRAILELLAPLVFPRFAHLGAEGTDFGDRVAIWKRFGLLSHVRSVALDSACLKARAGEAAVQRLFAGVTPLASVYVSSRDDEISLRAVLCALPCTVRELEVVDRGAQAVGFDQERLELPQLRRLKYTRERNKSMSSTVLADIIARSPDLEELEVSLAAKLSAFESDPSDLVGDKVRPRITAWDIRDEYLFSKLCQKRDFKPRRITASDIRWPVREATLRALGAMDSVTTMHFAVLESDELLAVELSRSIEELSIDRLRPTMFAGVGGAIAVVEQGGADAIPQAVAGFRERHPHVRMRIGKLTRFPETIRTSLLPAVRQEVEEWRRLIPGLRVSRDLAELVRAGGGGVPADEVEDESDDREVDRDVRSDAE
ncbi:hypothetical protein DFJ74DRAFT_767416 [Hyaloraphidium curvatum]|nr:hypothetical protein DFJ74DRAFT_767416 [Hyaloraphidium curvatum]